MQLTTLIPYFIAALITLLFLLVYRKGLKSYAKQLLVCLVERAEEALGGGTGKLKYSLVASKLYEIMPKPFKFIFSEKSIEYMIEAAVSEMKESIAKQSTNAISEESAV